MCKMPDYQEMYYKLFNRITDIIEELKEIQKQAEELYIRSENNVFVLFKEKEK